MMTIEKKADDKVLRGLVNQMLKRVYRTPSDELVPYLKNLIPDESAVSGCAEACDVDDSTVRKWRSGNRQPKKINVILLSLYKNLSFEDFRYLAVLCGDYTTPLLLGAELYEYLKECSIDEIRLVVKILDKKG